MHVPSMTANPSRLPSITVTMLLQSFTVPVVLVASPAVSVVLPAVSKCNNVHVIDLEPCCFHSQKHILISMTIYHTTMGRLAYPFLPTSCTM